MTRLEHLDLFGHDLSDASVPILAGMTELQELALKSRLPQLEVDVMGREEHD